MATTWGADLTKMDRTIAKEPAYQSKPKYCLLVFGPQAKTRVWVVQDGNTLYIDRNGNGDLTEKGEAVVWKAGSQSMAAGNVTSSDGISQYAIGVRKYSSSMRLSVGYDGNQRYLVGDPDGDPLVFSERISEAPIVHIAGPRSIELSYYGVGGGSMALRVRVGTPGLGTGSFAALVLPDVTPVAEVEFPSKKPGGTPIVVKAALKHR
jgi:hypothetical protein